MYTQPHSARRAAQNAAPDALAAAALARSFRRGGAGTRCGVRIVGVPS